jgi:hypothetical protein
LVALVILVENQLMEMITVAADKAILEANLAMAVAEHLVTDEMKVTEVGAVAVIVKNPTPGPG